MSERLGISPGFSISFAADGRAQTHGLRNESAEDLVERWIDAHPDDPRRGFALEWLAQHFWDISEDQRVQDSWARREEFMKRWRQLVWYKVILPNRDALLPDALRKVGLSEEEE